MDRESSRSPHDRLLPWLAALAGIGAALSPFGLLCVIGLMLCGSLVISPLGGTVLLLITKPIVDSFWFLKADSPLGFALNLQSVTAAFVVPAVAVMLMTREKRLKFSTTSVLVILYLTISIVSALRSPFPTEAVSELLRILSTVAMFWLGLYVANSNKRVKILCWALATTGVVPAVSALLQWSGWLGPVAGAVHSPEKVFRVTGFYHHPLDIAWRTSISFIFGVALAVTVKERGTRHFLFAWAVIAAALAAATIVRSVLVVLTIQALVWLWLLGKRRLALSIVPAVLLIGLALPPVRTVVREAVKPLREGRLYEFGTGRALLVLSQLRAFQDADIGAKLLGRGLHSAPLVNVLYSPLPGALIGGADVSEGHVGAHNQYLRLLTESGAVGLGVLLALLISAGRDCRRYARLCVSSDRRVFAQGTFVLLIGAIVYSVTAHPLDEPSTAWPLFLCMGVVSAWKRFEVYNAQLSSAMTL